MTGLKIAQCPGRKTEKNDARTGTVQRRPNNQSGSRRFTPAAPDLLRGQADLFGRMAVP